MNAHTAKVLAAEAQRRSMTESEYRAARVANPFTHNGRRCQVVEFLGLTSVRVRWADATALEISEGTHQAVVSCLDLKTTR